MSSREGWHPAFKKRAEVFAVRLRGAHDEYKNMGTMNRKSDVKKVYGMPGVSESSVMIPIFGGMTLLRVSFRGGMMDGFNRTVAKAVVSNPMYQHAIERSDYFKQGRIILLKTIENREKAVREDPVQYPSIRNAQAARMVLMKRFGVGLERLQDRSAILQAAEDCNVSFPNLKQ